MGTWKFRLQAGSNKPAQDKEAIEVGWLKFNNAIGSSSRSPLAATYKHYIFIFP